MVKSNLIEFSRSSVPREKEHIWMSSFDIAINLLDDLCVLNIEINQKIE